MMSWGKRKDGQAYPKRKKSGTKKSGSTHSSGIKIKKQKPKSTKTKWRMWRDYPEIDLVGTFKTKNEAINYAKWANEGDAKFTYNYTHKVWDGGDYTISDHGHPQLESNKQQAVEEGMIGLK